MTPTPDGPGPDELRDISWRLSRRIIEMTTRAGSGHPSSSLSAIDVMVALFFGGLMDHDPDDPGKADRDRFILSKGHAAPALYAVLAEAGYFPQAWLDGLRRFGNPLEGHPNRRLVPGVEASTGSLGQGLSIGLGHALAARLDDRAYRVYVLLGDGEVDEGQVWEATMAAAKYGVENLVAIVDQNDFQQTGPVADVMPSLPPFADKWRAFGWHVARMDGHDMADVVRTLREARAGNAAPRMVVAHTKKGRGLSVFEADDVNRKHGEPLTPEEAEQALAELDRAHEAEKEGR